MAFVEGYYRDSITVCRSKKFRRVQHRLKRRDDVFGIREVRFRVSVIQVVDNNFKL